MDYTKQVKITKEAHDQLKEIKDIMMGASFERLTTEAIGRYYEHVMQGRENGKKTVKN